MPEASGYLIDTNILLRLSKKTDPHHPMILAAVEQINLRGSSLFFTMQNITEFWNVSTRPIERNGFGLSPTETHEEVRTIERTMSLLPDTHAVYTLWRQLVLKHDIRGVQVHDARLAAVVQTYKVSHILTFNTSDFARYPQIQAIHPTQL